MNYFGTKELYGVTLRSTSNMEINGEFFEEGEPIISFDKIQIAYLNEQKVRHYAQGGYGNQTFVRWEDTYGLRIQLSEGIVSKAGLSLISNSKLFKKKDAKIIIPYNEILTSEKEDEDWILNLRYPIYNKPYVRRNGEKISNFNYGNFNAKGKIKINDVEDDIETEAPIYVVYYDYIYNNNFSDLYIGKRLVKGFLSLTGRMRLKDDQSGKETTCLIEIPKVELMSDLTMRLGSEVNPQMYNFQLQAHPVGDRGNQYVCKFTMLDRDIDSDI